MVLKHSLCLSTALLAMLPASALDHAHAASTLPSMNATASAWWKESGPAHAFDGNWQTLYIGTGEGNTLEGTFAAPQRITQVSIGFHGQFNHRPRAYRLELQTSQGQWVDVARVEKTPDELMTHTLDEPIDAVGMRITALQLSTARNMSIREVVINRPVWATTRNLEMPRPALQHNPAVRVQPFDATLKFYHHGEGLLFYAQGLRHRLDAMLVVTPLAADKSWFTTTYGMARHRYASPFVFEGDNLTVDLDGPGGRQQLAVKQNADAIELTQTPAVNATPLADVQATGLVFRLPVDFWAGGQWRIGAKSGPLDPVYKATGELAALDDIINLPVEAHEGKVTLELIPRTGRGRLTLQIARHHLRELKLARRSGFTGHFLDLYAVHPRANAARSWRIEFDPQLPRPWWESFGHASQESVRQLLNTDAAGVTTSHSGSPGRLSEQILDADHPFYGAIPDTTGDRGGLIEAVPLHTRNHVIQLARRYRQTGNAAELQAVMAGMDYLSATVAPWGQYGDIRAGGWVEAPFFWDIVGLAEVIEIIRPHADEDRLCFWLAGLHRQFKAVEAGTKHRLHFKDDIGPNMVTFAVQLFRMAQYFKDDASRDLAREAMSFALALNPSEHGGLQEDGSYSHGNQFDTGYYRWLLDQSFIWHNLTQETPWELAGEDRQRWQQMQDAFLWLFDNGQLNTMSAHGKNRLIESNLASMTRHGSPILWEPVQQRAQHARDHGKAALIDYIGDDRQLPLGSRYFNVAGMFVDRSDSRYLSFWWNEKARVRDDAGPANANYNVKTPLGAYYLRSRQAARELTIPADNIHHSGAILTQGMETESDWATGFANYQGSRLSQPVKIGDATVFVADMQCRSKQSPDAPVRMLMTTLIAPSEVVRVISAPPQAGATPVILQPLVVRARHEKDPSLKSVRWEPLHGDMNYQWSLSDQPMDGSQRYSSIPPAKVWRLRASWNASSPLTTAWRIAHQSQTQWRVESVTPAQQQLRSSGGEHLIITMQASSAAAHLKAFPQAYVLCAEKPAAAVGREVQQHGAWWLVLPASSRSVHEGR